MTAPRIDVPVRRLIEALVDCADPRLRDRLLVEAALTTGAARAAALWRGAADDSWNAVLERGPEDLLPTRGDLAAAADHAPLPAGRHVLVARGGETPLALALGGMTPGPATEEALDSLEAMLVAWSILGDASPDELAALPSALPGADQLSDEREGPSLAHDLRNLLSGIQTTLDVLDTCGDGMDAEELERFEGTVGRELSLASELLSGLFEADPTASETAPEAHCFPAEILEDLARSEHARTHSAGGRLSVEVDEATRELRVGLGGSDFDRIARNLVVNAREADPSGEVRVELLDAPGPERGVVLCVRDRGPGLPPGLHGADALDSACNSVPSTKGPGRGRGLSILGSLVRRAGGRLRARTVPTGGACFEIWLPGMRP